MEDKSNLNIPQWAEEDRPREKLQLKGRSVLTDAELIAILIGSGTREESAVTLAQRILHKVEGNLNALGRMSLHEMTKFKGMGMAKAVSIIAALELGRRRQDVQPGERLQVRSSKDAYSFLASHLSDLPHEEFWVIYLNRANRVITREQVSRGGISGTVADARVIYKKALECVSTAVILVHNHPSGNLEPSEADIRLTKKLKEAGQLLDIQVLDHLIISEKGYFSFADDGIL